MDKHATSTGNPRRGQNGRHRGAERVHRSVQLALDAAAQSRQEGGGVATLFVRYSEMRQNPQSVGRSNGETFSARFRTYEKMQSPQNVGKPEYDAIVHALKGSSKVLRLPNFHTTPAMGRFRPPVVSKIPLTTNSCPESSKSSPSNPSVTANASRRRTRH